MDEPGWPPFNISINCGSWSTWKQYPGWSMVAMLADLDRAIKSITLPLMRTFTMESDTDNWKSEVVLSEDFETKLISCVIKVYSDNAAKAWNGCEFLRNLFAVGREAFMRLCEPDVSTGVDLDTGKKYHMAFTKFTYFDRPGEWSYVENQTGLRVCEGLGNL
jgi:hypothetical protein